MSYDSSFLSSGARQLTPNEKQLIHDFHFAEDLMLSLKLESQNLLYALPQIDPEGGDIMEGNFQGIHSSCSEARAVEAVLKLKESFRDRGYLIFVFDDGEYTKSIAVIRGTDDIDILSYRKTDGFNQNVSTEIIKSQLQGWQAEHGLTIIGCGKDWIEIKFETLPEDKLELMTQIQNFCPDVIRKGAESIENLTAMVQSSKSVFLWWD